MSYSFGNAFKVSCFGQSHSECIGGLIEGVPKNLKLDIGFINAFMKKRRPGQNAYSTKRFEKDEPIIKSGVDRNFVTDGTPVAFEIKNNNAHSEDYGEKLVYPRPMHADFPAFMRYGDNYDFRGGGQFSGRMTAVMCFAGAVALTYLSEKGINIGAHALSVYNIKDTPFDPVNIDRKQLLSLFDSDYPVTDREKLKEMLAAIEKAGRDDDSLGGTVECAAINLPVGLGEPMYDSVESVMSKILFSIPAVKGVEFGAGFSSSLMKGSEHNDGFFTDGKKVYTKQNNHGGILGGMTTGMPLIFRVAIKPTPSIAKKQNTVNIREMKNAELEIKGRHDPCIVMRAVPCVVSACACALADLMIQGTEELIWN